MEKIVGGRLRVSHTPQFFAPAGGITHFPYFNTDILSKIAIKIGKL